MKLKTILLPLLLLALLGSVQADEKKVESVSKDELREMIRELIQEEMANQETPPNLPLSGEGQEGSTAAKAGEILAHTCAGCHGTNGTLENEAFMPLAGMPEQEFVKTMLDFRDGARQSTLMGTVANGLSEQQIRDMARYFMEVSP
ncbi:c-type cytochrome [Thiothrix unzii]|uniref:C-type cytochrome n=1 Tax=Thiothrix unzii TaxID=111769 RepID=A0A975IG23_9GAMM|nr:c-type cytochrome [Thiothrix unzii]QTR52083.1 c-type cytochrome [Thiothrix unzii]